MKFGGLIEELYRPTRQRRLEAILPTLAPEKAERVRRNEQLILWYSPEYYFDTPHRVKRYCHGDRCEVPWELTQYDAASSGLEWVYVFDAAGRTMTTRGKNYRPAFPVQLWMWRTEIPRPAHT